MPWYMSIILGISIIQGVNCLERCDPIICNSEENAFDECVLFNDIQIINATVTAKVSESDCTYYNGRPENYNGTDGNFGFHGNTLWVDNGCRALFAICYTDEILTSTPPTTSALTSTFTTLVTSSTQPTSTLVTPTQQSGTTTPVTSTDNGQGKQHKNQGQQEWISDIPNEAVILVPLALVVIITFTILGICLWSKRSRRNRCVEKHAVPELGGQSKKWMAQNIQSITDQTLKASVLTVDDGYVGLKQEQYANYLSAPSPIQTILKVKEKAQNRPSGKRVAPSPPVSDPAYTNCAPSTENKQVGDNGEYLTPQSQTNDLPDKEVLDKNMKEENIYATID